MNVCVITPSSTTFTTAPAHTPLLLSSVLLADSSSHANLPSTDPWTSLSVESIHIGKPSTLHLLHSPVESDTTSRVVLVSVGDDHILYSVSPTLSATSTDASSEVQVLYGAGRNKYGQLGIGYTCDFTDSPTRIQVPCSEAIIAISAGTYFSAMLTSSGKVYTFGCGAYHRLGINASDQLGNSAALVVDTCVPLLVESLLETGSMYAIGSPLFGSSTGVMLIGCGMWHTVAVTDSDVYVWGWCKYGQCNGQAELLLAAPTRVTALDHGLMQGDEWVTKVQCGARFTALLTSAGQVIVINSVYRGALQLSEDAPIAARNLRDEVCIPAHFKATDILASHWTLAVLFDV